MIKKIFCITLFSIAMGYLETAVVVYLRVLYYPSGFCFPIVPTSTLVLKTELWRELATIIMLAAIGYLAGETKAQKFAFFIYSFAIWDMFYYLFLKILLNWPISLLDWDILFLLPVPWIGPVLAPCIVAITMIVLNFIILKLEMKAVHVNFTVTFWLFLLIGCFIIIISFITDYLKLAPFDFQSSNSLFMLEQIKEYKPIDYNWLLFSFGELLLLISLFLVYHHNQKLLREPNFIKTI